MDWQALELTNSDAAYTGDFYVDGVSWWAAPDTAVSLQLLADVGGSVVEP